MSPSSRVQRGPLRAPRAVFGHGACEPPDRGRYGASAADGPYGARHALHGGCPCPPPRARARPHEAACSRGSGRLRTRHRAGERSPTAAAVSGRHPIVWARRAHAPCMGRLLRLTAHLGLAYGPDAHMGEASIWRPGPFIPIWGLPARSLPYGCFPPYGAYDAVLRCGVLSPYGRVVHMGWSFSILSFGSSQDHMVCRPI